MNEYLNRLYLALQAADSAGNIQDAQAIANEIRRVQSSSVTQPQFIQNQPDAPKSDVKEVEEKSTFSKATDKVSNYLSNLFGSSEDLTQKVNNNLNSFIFLVTR